MNRRNELARDLGFWLSRKTGHPWVAPDTLQISVTSRCNLRCKMCDVWERADEVQELTFEEIRSVMDQCARWGVREVNLCGGEPLLRETCFDIIKHAKDIGMRVILTTNGTLIDERMARKLIDSKLDILTISLDGAKAETHDTIRGQQGAFDKILKGIEHLNRLKNSSGPIKVLILTLSNYNFEDLEEYFWLAEKLSADSLYITPVVANNVELYKQSPDDDKNGFWISGERLKKFEKIFEKFDALQKGKYHLDYPSYALLKKYFGRKVGKNDWTCFAGYRRFVLLPDGSIQMCGEIIGNVRQTPSVKKLWTSPAARKRRAWIKQCRQYCLQDCHARRESASLENAFRKFFKAQP